MASFIGQYEAKIDDKGRLVFPAAFKALLPEGELPRLVIKKNIFEDCLEMYTGKEGERQSEELNPTLISSTRNPLRSGESICETVRKWCWTPA